MVAKKTIYLEKLMGFRAFACKGHSGFAGHRLRQPATCSIIGVVVMGLHRSEPAIPKIRYLVGLMRMKRALLDKFYRPWLI